MPVIKYAHICEYARAEASGTVSIIGIFDTIHVSNFPARFPLLHVIASMAGQQGEQFHFSTRIAGPDGSVVQAVPPVTIHVEQEHMGVNQINGYMGTVFPAPGEYTVEFIVDEMVVHTIPFRIIQRGPK
jgi:hypothetical protein